MSTSNVQPASTTAGLPLDIAYRASSRESMAGSGIDDPVNDTGLSPHHGDFQHSNEFSCLLKMICAGRGEF